MAQIDLIKLKKTEKERYKVQEPVYTTYSVFEEDGSKFIQIDMYGKSDREFPGKVSQTVQFDRNTAKFFVNLFTQEYNLK